MAVNGLSFLFSSFIFPCLFLGWGLRDSKSCLLLPLNTGCLEKKAVML